MVPVLDSNKVPLMPCTEKRARLLMERKQAVAYYQKSIFCIRLTKEPSAKHYQQVALGIDPGSKREGYTVATKNAVVLNITTNTPHWVKTHLESRRMLRRARRSRKAPYRICRWNRATLRVVRIPPSTLARWNAKLRITKQLLRIIPITHINVEDIKAKPKKGKAQWNLSFSPLEVGKAWFYTEIAKLAVLSKTEGFATKEHRVKRGFEKSKAKLDYVWEAHNVDSHCLAELVLECAIRPYSSLYRIDFLEHFRRQLHLMRPQKGGMRRRHGKTHSMGIPRGSAVRWKNSIVFLGGTDKNRLTLHSIESGGRITHSARIEDITLVFVSKQRTQLVGVKNA